MGHSSLKQVNQKFPLVHPENYTWEYGMPSLIKDGKRIAVVTNGVMIKEAIEAADVLKQKMGLNLKL